MEDSDFKKPSVAEGPRTWWHWNNGHVAREGITADLEAFAAVGIAGVQLFYPSCTIPNGPVSFGTPEWRGLVVHAARECRRLGLEFCMHNCPGWSSSGGPWIKPERAMKVLTTADTRVKGPHRFDGILPKPPMRLDFYRDVATLAFRAPQPETGLEPIPIRATTAGGANGSAVFDGDPETFVELEPALSGRPCYLELEYERPISARTLKFEAPGPFWWQNKGRLEASDDGVVYREVTAFTFCFGFETRVVTFPRITVKFFRIVLTDVSKNIQSIKLASVTLSDALGIAELAQKSAMTRDHGDLQLGETPESEQAFEEGDVVRALEVVDLTDRVGEDGRLVWDAPDGEWVVLRVGYTLTGRRNGPAPIGGVGLECDKLSPAGVQAHWDDWLKGLIDEMRTGGGRIDGLVLDSYEVGSQNWTHGMEEEFERRRCYAITQFLPVFSGRVVDSPEATDRFLWDFRRTFSELFCENYAGKLAELSHSEGLKLNLEPYGSCPVDNMQYGAQADVPMCEFWTGGELNAGNAKFAASIGHVHGKPVVGAEAFTSSQGDWTRDPFALKAQGDFSFCEGVNRIVFHTSPHQPWVDPPRFPGIVLGNIGTHFGRQVTWWSKSAPYIDYLARCQHMLRQGVFQADFCFYNGGGAPWRMGARKPPAGYDFDWCDTEALLSMTVEDGRIILPSGMRYRVLVLPDIREMPAEALRKICDLIDDGAAVAGALPERVGGLGNRDEAELIARANNAWKSQNVYSDAVAFVAESGLRHDFVCDDQSVKFIHRADGDAEIYFLASPEEEAHTAQCEFRVTGLLPEFWDPVSGEIAMADDWDVLGGVTRVAVPFDPVGSVFVVFRKPTEKRGGRPGPAPECLEVEIAGPWHVSFAKGWGAPESIELERLISWTDHPLDGVRYFSGTATYRCNFQSEAASGRVVLDLGSIANICEVRLNGVDLGIRWKPPFRFDATAALREGGNSLEVDVVNLWPNRMIGDAKLPEDCLWKGPRLMEIPEWLLRGEPSPAGHVTFSTWKIWGPDDEPLPSGLLGPVRLLLLTE